MNQRVKIKENGPVSKGAQFLHLSDIYNIYCDTTPRRKRKEDN